MEKPFENMCVGLIFQNGKIKGYLHNVKVIIEKAPFLSSIFPQPLDYCKEVSGVMVQIKKVKINTILQLQFVSVGGIIIEGDFYINPYIQVDNRTFFELQGALTLR